MRLLSKITLSIILALVFIVALGFHATGGNPHEWTGLLWCVLVIVHCWWHRRWFSAVLKGKHSFRRAAGSAVILLLAVGLVTICVTGLMNSSHILGFMQLDGDFEAKRIHSIASYWSLILAGIHVGMHWRTVAGAFANEPSAATLAAFRLAALAIVVSGVWASFDRSIGTKLFAGAAFDFWNPERPAILLVMANFAILGMYAVTAHIVFSMRKKRPAPDPVRLTAPGRLPEEGETKRTCEE